MFGPMAGRDRKPTPNSSALRAPRCSAPSSPSAASPSNRKKTMRTTASNHSPNASSRSEEHTSELQSLMRISYAVFCLKKNKIIHRLIDPDLMSADHLVQYDI